ncbi:MAG: hypothetical protein K0S80_5231 [Neobacillus sp.]|nr:hypothetical protein [Neobacillus sp.]
MNIGALYFAFLATFFIGVTVGDFHAGQASRMDDEH